MPETWRDQMRSYKDQWIIGLMVVLSLLFHIGLFVIFYSGILNFGHPQKPQSIDFDLADADLKYLDQAANQPRNTVFEHLQPTEKSPDSPTALGYQNHDGGPTTHRADRPINDIQRDPGQRGPGSGPPSGSRGDKNNPIPEIGEGVGENQASKKDPSQRPDPFSQSMDQMISKTGMQFPSAGGGQDGINPYNPNVGEKGEKFSINTQEFRGTDYFKHMRDKIYLVWTYPQEAQRNGQQGIVHVEFTILRSGEVTSIKINSSGYRILDQYVVKALQEVNFNPLPAKWPEKQLTVTANFIYQLTGGKYIE